MPLPLPGIRRFTPTLLPALVLTASLLAGCASTTMKAVVRDGEIKSPGTESVVFWNLQVIDLTGTMATDSKNCIPKILMKQLDVDNYGSARFIEPWYGEEEAPSWKEGDGFTAYDALMSVSMEEGDFFLHYIKLFPGHDETGYTSLLIPYDRHFFVEGGGLLHLGTVRVIISSKAGDEYTFTADHTWEVAEPVARRYSEEFPLIWSSYGGDYRRTVPGYLLEEDFDGYLAHPFPDDVHVNRATMRRAVENDGENGVYNIDRESADGGFDFAAMNSRPPLGSDSPFSVAWDAKWYGGDNTYPYGLILGDYPDSALFFAGSGNGQAAVFRMTRGEWDTNPLDWTVPENNAGGGSEQEPASARRYRVDYLGKTVRYSVDGEQIAEFPAKMRFGSLFLGLYVTDKQSVGFDNLLVEERIGN